MRSSEQDNTWRKMPEVTVGRKHRTNMITRNRSNLTARFTLRCAPFDWRPWTWKETRTKQKTTSANANRTSISWTELYILIWTDGDVHERKVWHVSFEEFFCDVRTRFRAVGRRRSRTTIQTMLANIIACLTLIRQIRWCGWRILKKRSTAKIDMKATLAE